MTPIVSRSNRRPLAIALVSLAAVVLLGAGCGETVGYTEATGDKTNGKELFTSKCGSCHTLADAGTTGTIGPNLDDAFAESRRNGLGESTFVQVVRDQIAYSDRGALDRGAGNAGQHRHRPGRDRRLDLRRERRRHRQGAGACSYADDHRRRRPSRGGRRRGRREGRLHETTAVGVTRSPMPARREASARISTSAKPERRPRHRTRHERPGRDAVVLRDAHGDADRRRLRVRLQRRRQVARLPHGQAPPGRSRVEPQRIDRIRAARCRASSRRPTLCSAGLVACDGSLTTSPAPCDGSRRSASLGARVGRSSIGRVADDMRDGHIESRACCLHDARSSQFDDPGGCVEMMIASAEKLRSASSRACSGSPSPISPRTRSPAP